MPAGPAQHSLAWPGGCQSISQEVARGPQRHGLPRHRPQEHAAHGELVLTARVWKVSGQLLGRRASPHFSSSDRLQHRRAAFSPQFLSSSCPGKEPTNSSKTGLTTPQTLLHAAQGAAKFLHHLHPCPAGKDTYGAAPTAKPGLPTAKPGLPTPSPLPLRAEVSGMAL